MVKGLSLMVAVPAACLSSSLILSLTIWGLGSSVMGLVETSIELFPQLGAPMVSQLGAPMVSDRIRAPI